LNEDQKGDLLSNSWRLNYRDRPPTPEEFLTEKYLGPIAPTIWPQVKQAFIDFMNPTSPYRTAVLYSFIGFGKALANTESVYTPNGPMPIGQMKVGDEVCTPSGGTAKIDGVFPQGLRPLYKMTFSDGRSVIADEEHLWKAAKSKCSIEWDKQQKKYTRKKIQAPDWKIITTKKILDSEEKNPKERWFIPLPRPTHHTTRVHIIPPYTMGALLGDGHFGANINLVGNDPEIHGRVESELTNNVRIKVSRTQSCEFQSTFTYHHTKGNPYKEELTRLGLRDARSLTKFIPDEYLYDSVWNRIELLQGLMDTDGTVVKRSGLAIFNTVSEKLRDNMITLVRGLGGLASWSADNTTRAHCISNLPCYFVFISFPENTFPIFTLMRKQEIITYHFNRPRTKRKTQFLYLTKIEKLNEGEATCITLDDEEHLFLTNDYIVTHNSYLAVLLNMYIGVHLSMMRSPWKFFGHSPATVYTQVFCATSQKKSSELLFEPMLNMLESSAFFEKVHTREAMGHRERDFARMGNIDRIFWTTAVPTSAIQFSNGANFKLISSPGALLGQTIVSGTMTELTFFYEAGKALTLDSKIMTPQGHILMGDVKIGIAVLNSKGGTSVVQKVFPQGKTEVYRITFQDGRFVDTCPNHNWTAAPYHGYLADGSKKQYWRKVTTQEIFETKDKHKWRIPLCLPCDHSPKDHLISPYILGSLLGDGHFSGAHKEVGLTCSDEDALITIPRIEKEAPEGIRITHNPKYIQYHFRQEKDKGYDNQLWRELERLGLERARSNDKFIPDEYLYDSTSNRVALLQGLMDTDGTVNKKGKVCFHSNSKALIDGVVELCRGLGGLAYSSINKINKYGNTEYVVHINFPSSEIMPFYLTRKKERALVRYSENRKRPRSVLMISKIEKIEDQETQCILVDDKDHLFLTNDYIVTHNSDDFIFKFFSKLRGRIESRMKGNYFGRFILDSSPNTLESPIDDWVVHEAPKNPSNFIISGSRWKWVKNDFPADTYDEEGNVRPDKAFQVYLGGKGRAPMIIDNIDRDQYAPEDVIDVPSTGTAGLLMRGQFEENIYEALKDQAGIPAGSSDKIFYDYAKIEKCFDSHLKSVYTHIVASSKDSPEGIIWNQIKDQFFIKYINSYQFWYKPHVPRVFAVDQSISGDVTAIVIAHLERELRRVNGLPDPQMSLIYVIDLIVPIIPKGGRINLDAIRYFIEDLRDKGSMQLMYGSFDQFQSEATMQYLLRRGFEVEKLSVDKEMDPYLNFVSIIESDRLRAGRNIHLKNNLKSLQITRRKDPDGRKTGSQKVDHTNGDIVLEGSINWDTSLIGIHAKDISDAACACCELLRKHDVVPYEMWEPEEIREKTRADATKQINALLEKNKWGVAV
jgi:hypothetical protein